MRYKPLMLKNQTILLAGCGRMGGALLQGWLAGGLPREAVTIVEPNAEGLKQAMDTTGMTVVASADAVPEDTRFDLVFLALKPQVMGDALPDYRRFAESGSLFISVAAGKSIAFFQEALGPQAGLVRAMPNTPALIGEGMTVGYATATVKTEQKELAEALFRAAGDFFWVEKEPLIDAATAVAGSGPAYIFYLMECLAKAGEEAGLTGEQATRLAVKTVAGSSRLAQESEQDLATLRQNVTSPGGTTEAALKVLMRKENGMETLIGETVGAALKRAGELAD